MTRMQVRAWTATLLMLSLAAVVHAAQPRIVFSPGLGVTAGDVVTVGWSGLPAEFEECEFLLDRGNGEVIRLTPQLPPGGGSFRWTVPNLPSSGAVLLLRAGIDGVETVLAASEPFAIHGVARAARVEFRNGEWWIFTPGPPAAEPPVLQRVLYADGTAGAVPPRDWLLYEGVVLGEERRHELVPVSAARIDTRCGAPLVVPQRK
jgi:hypothetical protein